MSAEVIEGKRVAVIGGGAWGSSISKVLTENGHQVSLWCYLDEEANAVNVDHRSLRLEDVVLPKGIEAHTDFASVFKHSPDWMVIALSSSQLGQLEEVSAHYDPKTPVIILTKGFVENQDSLLAVDRITEILKPENAVVLSGPNLALEIAKQQYSSTVVACKEEETAIKAQELLSNRYFRAYASTDVIGASLGGILKNVIAIAAGTLDGLDLGNNVKAALIARGLHEISTVGVALGAKKETFYGLSGVGDLVTTCSSSLSRNWQFGYALTQSNDTEAVIKNLSQVTEGIKTARIVKALAEEHGLELPIMAAVYRVIYEEAPVNEMLDALMAQELSVE